MTRRPLVLYLDASDISRFADLGTVREPANVAEAYAKLRQHIDRGDVEVRFSCTHIAKVAKSGCKELAHRKAAVIERLSGSLCFHLFHEIWKREVWLQVQSSMAEPRFAIPYALRSDDGLWMLDGSGILQLDLDVEMKNALKQLPLNHSQRRALRARLWKNGHLTELGLSLLRRHWSGVGAEISKRFPVTDANHIVKLFGRLLAGSVDKQHFEQEFARFLSRPTQMATFIFEMDEIRKHCPQFVVAIGERLVKMVSDLRAGLAPIPQTPRRKLARYLPDTIARKPAVQAALRDRHRIRGANLTLMTPAELVAARKSLGMTQAELAEALRLGKHGGRTVRGWEIGERDISGPAEVAVELMLRQRLGTDDLSATAHEDVRKDTSLDNHQTYHDRLPRRLCRTFATLLSGAPEGH